MGAEYISVINNAGGNTAKGTFSVNTMFIKQKEKPWKNIKKQQSETCRIKLPGRTSLQIMKKKK